VSTPTSFAVPRRELGSTGLNVSAFALGSWHTYDRMDFRDAVSLLSEAVDAGINFFDVGVYAMPGGPQVFTDVIFSAMVRATGLQRDDYLVSSKLWLEGFTPEEGFEPQLANALVRAGVEHADVAVLGDLRRDDLRLEDLVADLEDLRQRGLLRAWGVNNWSASNVQRLFDIADEQGAARPAFAQLKYSVARRSIPEGEPFARLFEQGFELQASDVMEGGILAGRPVDSREVGRDPGGIRQRTIDLAPEIARIAAELNATPAQLLIAFTLTHPATFTTLFGTSRVAQLRENLGAVALLERVGAPALRAAVEGLWADRGLVDPEGP
jgi:aryl-alcohol dehydrogenase-like predicted oxidoreductase